MSSRAEESQANRRNGEMQSSKAVKRWLGSVGFSASELTDWGLVFNILEILWQENLPFHL